ncbi:MAG: hypothetical protein AB4042_21865 [Leptolyngbyaceae cyanobacterium]
MVGIGWGGAPVPDRLSDRPIACCSEDKGNHGGIALTGWLESSWGGAPVPDRLSDRCP